MHHSLFNMKINSNQAFTLIEVIIVISILGIISAISMPALFNKEHKLKKAARELFGDMQKTRSYAISTGKECGIWFDTDNNRYIISADKGGDDTWSTFGTDDPSQTVKKIVSFSGYASGVQYGHGAATKNAKFSADTVFPEDDVAYNGNVLTFNATGQCDTNLKGYGYRFVYLEYGDSTYAIGTGSTGVIELLYWTGGAWK